NLPYTGSGVTASALCLNKLRTKEILLFHGLPTPPYVSLPRGSFPSKLPFDFPVVVKPNSLGSTIGISIVKEKKHLAAAVEKAFSHDSEVFIEKYISGVEVTVSLLGNDPPAVLPMIQIETASGFYDYKAKYTPGASRHRIPPELPEKARKKAARVSLKAYLILGCRDLARIDLMVDRDGHPWILDVNTIPGFTRTSLVPDAARAAGIEFDELCDRLIALAISRQCRQ
ncbi:MAG TPA: D-alanine--D-alanine ligase, partial [bacterium]|nr:D-alanine--D-alanine ligase [bacterium]